MSDRINELVREIDATAQDVFSLSTRAKAKEKAGSRRKAYRKGLQEVRRVAGNAAAHELAEWIQAEMRRTDGYPSARKVRQQGAKICRDAGHDVSTNDWLGA